MNPGRRRCVVSIACVSLAIGGAACGDDGPQPASEPTPQSESVVVTDAVETTGVVVPVIALDNTFRPQAVEAHVGDTVEWENRGTNDHNVLSIEGDTWGVEVTDFEPGDVYSHVFTEPGEYAYFCSIHGNEQVGMVGTVTVLP